LLKLRCCAVTKKPDNFSPNAGLLPYASNVSGPAIVLPDMDGFKSERGSQAANFFDERVAQLNREYAALVELAKQTELVYNAKYNFVPRVGKTYYLYQKQDTGTMLSMISPQEWRNSNMEFLGSYIFTADAVWERIDGKEETGN